MARPSLDTPAGLAAASTLSVNSVQQIENEKPVASGNGVAVSIMLAEPNVFLSGLDHDGRTGSAASALLRGKLRLNVTKSAKIKSVTLKFTGKARTDWPEGIPPERTITFEDESLRNQVMPFFNAMYDGSEVGYGTMCSYTLRDKLATSSVTNLSTTDLDQPSSPRESIGGFTLPILNNRSSRAGTLLSNKENKRLSLQSNQSRSFTKSDSPYGPTPQQKGYKVFHPGTYDYNFELPIDNNSPETTSLQLASVKWQLEALVERSGTFRPNLQGFKEIPVIRSPSEDSLELTEPISISRTWEDQMHYEIMISGKAFPLGSRIAIAYKLMPLAKVQIHRIRVYVTETCEYFTANKKVTRKDVTRKILLLEKSAGKPLAKEYSSSDVRILRGGEFDGEQRHSARAQAQRMRDYEARRTGTVAEPLPEPTENILGDIDLGLEQYWGATEMEMNVQIPTCETMEKERTKKMHPDCSWKNVNVHHWIKIVMRISRVDTDDPTGKKRRHFEISIDSPITILDCRASKENLALPEYSGQNANVLSQQHVCGCPNSAFKNVSPASSSGEVPTLNSLNGGDGPADGPEVFVPDLARPPQAHLSSNAMVQRPIHMLRNPSYNPPPFDAEQPPPPMATPPPLYDNVIGTPSVDGLADYFARLGEAYDDDEPTDDDDRAYSNGRVNVANPRTPGGRLARSMDISRNFMFNEAALNNLTGGRDRRDSSSTAVQE